MICACKHGFEGTEQIEHLVQRTLKGTWGDAKQVAIAVHFLIESDSMTGECVTIDGGERWAHVRSRLFTDAGGE